MEVKMEDEKLETSVLIVDDSSLNIRVVSNIIAPHGYKIQVAKNGAQALKLLTKFKPTAIIMDIQMPNMSGFECCQRIKSIASRAHIPVIFLSGSHDEKDKKRAMDIGAKAYLTKPIDPELLLSELGCNIPFASA